MTLICQTIRSVLAPAIHVKATTLTLAYLGVEDEAIQRKALEVLNTLITIDLTCAEPIPIARSNKSLKGLFDSSKDPLPIDFRHKEGYKIEKIETSSGSFFKPDPNLLSAMIAVSEANARFKLNYNKKEQICDVRLTYRGALPVWIKVGNPECWISAEKGVPTGKVITK